MSLKNIWKSYLNYRANQRNKRLILFSQIYDIEKTIYLGANFHLTITLYLQPLKQGFLFETAQFTLTEMNDSGVLTTLIHNKFKARTQVSTCSYAAMKKVFLAYFTHFLKGQAYAQKRFEYSNFLMTPEFLTEKVMNFFANSFIEVK